MRGACARDVRRERLSAAAAQATQALSRPAVWAITAPPVSLIPDCPMNASARTKHVRVEDDALVRGKGHFMDDPRLPNQAYAAFVRSPHAHARIVSVNADEARKAKGVLAVLTAADITAAGVGSLSRHPPVVGRGGAKMATAVPPGACRREGDAWRRSGGAGGGGELGAGAGRRRPGAGRLRGIAGGDRARRRHEGRDATACRKRPAI